MERDQEIDKIIQVAQKGEVAWSNYFLTAASDDNMLYPDKVAEFLNILEEAKMQLFQMKTPDRTACRLINELQGVLYSRTPELCIRRTYMINPHVRTE